MVNKHTQHLAFSARKAATRREYLAYYLALYQAQELITEDAMMDFVGCSDEAYYRLALCQVPDSQASDFAERLDKIAAYAGGSTSKIAQIIRQVAAIEALKTAQQPDQQDEVDTGQRDAFIDGTAVDLIRETRQMMDAADPGKKAAAQRSPTRSALLAARDRDEQGTEEKSDSDDEEHKLEE